MLAVTVTHHKNGFTLTTQYINGLRVNVNPFFLQKLFGDRRIIRYFDEKIRKMCIFVA